MKNIKETRLESLKERYGRDFYISSGLIRDSMCDTAEFKAIEKEVDIKVEEQMGDEYGTFGSCHRFWSIKKDMLKKDYGIDWLSPSELNPFVMFD